MMSNYASSRTPEAHVAAVRAAMAKVAKLPFVKQAWVDDWGRYSNFSCFATVATAARYGRARGGRYTTLAEPQGLLKIKAAILESLREAFPDEGKVRIRSVSRNGDCYNLDIDFYVYDAETNTFPERLAA